MKKIIILGIALLAFACAKKVVEKPDNLIGKDKMTNIIYDLAILEAMRSQKPIILEENGINQNTYIYKKYGIDSVQFAKSNQYYAADIVVYKQMYEEVAKRLESHRSKALPPNPNAGIIK
jgi:hypothetical protein